MNKAKIPLRALAKEQGKDAPLRLIDTESLVDEELSREDFRQEVAGYAEEHLESTNELRDLIELIEMALAAEPYHGV